jgi:apolipoprotein D and lipocalin family protein
MEIKIMTPTTFRSISLCWIKLAIVWLSLMVINGCSIQPPQGITAVTPFDVGRYEGLWYEIGRLDHSFERGLTDVNARYRGKPDGSIEVINRGFNPKSGEWEQATGRALFTDGKDRGSLKVSFFGPFYGGYHVVALDEKDYRWSLVMGPSRDYFWILSRDKQLPEALRLQLLDKARRFGIQTDQLIWVSQQRSDT